MARLGVPGAGNAAGEPVTLTPRRVVSGPQVREHGVDVAGVRTPAYIRDNIHVDLLSAAYAGFAESLTDEPFQHYGPSGYLESQGAFTERFARELALRLGVDCPVELATQTEFPEPRIRVNTDDASRFAPAWDEAAAWDGLAEYYLRYVKPKD